MITPKPIRTTGIIFNAAAPLAISCGAASSVTPRSATNQPKSEMRIAAVNIGGAR